MHDFADWVQVFAGAIGTIVTALAVSHKTNRADYKSIIKGKDDIISDLKEERDKYQRLYYSELERNEKLKKQKSTRP